MCVLAAGVVTAYRDWSQKDGEAGVLLTEGLMWVESQRRWPAARSGQRVVAELAEEIAAGVLRVPGLHGSARGDVAKVYKGSGRPEHQQR